MRGWLRLSLGALFALGTSAMPDGAVHAETAPTRLGPPSSLKPPDASVAVEIMHRHRAVRECVSLKMPRVCTARDSDADTATTVRFEPTGMVNAALDPAQGAVQVTFLHHVGPQAQTIRLRAGDWLIDWPGAPEIGHIHVVAGARPSVTLVTSSGRCHFQDDRCELDDRRIRRIRTREDG
jgi:hypothetical protein